MLRSSVLALITGDVRHVTNIWAAISTDADANNAEPDCSNVVTPGIKAGNVKSFMKKREKNESQKQIKGDVRLIHLTTWHGYAYGKVHCTD